MVKGIVRFSDKRLRRWLLSNCSIRSDIIIKIQNILIKFSGISFSIFITMLITSWTIWQRGQCFLWPRCLHTSLFEPTWLSSREKNRRVLVMLMNFFVATIPFNTKRVKKSSYSVWNRNKNWRGIESNNKILLRLWMRWRNIHILSFVIEKDQNI